MINRRVIIQQLSTSKKRDMQRNHKCLYLPLHLLQIHQLPILTLQSQQLLMRPLLDDNAPVQHEDDVRTLDRAEPVRDSNGRPPPRCCLQRLLHDFL